MTQGRFSCKSSLAYLAPMWHKAAQRLAKCCGSSVAEHSLGKGEVESSILSRSTMSIFFPLHRTSSPLPHKPNFPFSQALFPASFYKHANLKAFTPVSLSSLTPFIFNSRMDLPAFSCKSCWLFLTSSSLSFWFSAHAGRNSPYTKTL